MRGFSTLFLILCFSFLAACGGSKKQGIKQVGVTALPDEGLSNIAPYVESSPYSTYLKTCVTAAEGRSCTVDQLPPIGMEVESPTIPDIMDRVVVSHPWMGERFEEILGKMPGDMIYLFGALTAVVIDDDTRPSYYNPATGAIYLDPDYLWLTEEELAVINPKEDFRGEFIRQMAYRPVWRYVGDTLSSDNRTIDTITLDMAQLLFHELAHANDIFPPSSYATVNRSRRMEVTTDDLYDVFPSTDLLKHDPLTSAMMFHLAGILYRGNTASTSDRAVTAAQVGDYFALDGANDDYNYSSQWEDLAMLFEEAMMKLHFNLDRDVGFVTAANSRFCDDYKVGWGMRNRIGTEKVKQRAQWVVDKLLPHRDYSSWFASLPAPRNLPTNVGWCESEDLVGASQEKHFRDTRSLRLINPRHFLPSGALQNEL